MGAFWVNAREVLLELNTVSFGFWALERTSGTPTVSFGFWALGRTSGTVTVNETSLSSCGREVV